MNTKATKKLFAVLAALWCAITLTIPVFAADTSLMSEGTSITNCDLSISATGQASCKVLVRTQTSSQRIEVVISLYQISRNGSTRLNSWSDKGAFMLTSTKTHPVTKGYDYQATAMITIKDSYGNKIETIPISSLVVHY